MFRARLAGAANLCSCLLATKSKMPAIRPHLAIADRIVVLHRGAKVADDIPANTVTDDLIRTVFEIDVRVQRHSDGTPLVLPQLMTAIGPGHQGMS